ncbi:TonB-dependent receptor [candidate division WOR-3 bacterium]|nr:TonB-dependent receptor [candidate division WOR-3 bacterium]
MAGSALAQTGAVNGFVRDASDGEPLAYCNVYIDGTEYGSATNDKGYFYIGHVPPGEYEVVASYVGYKTQRRVVVVGPNQTANANLELSAGSIELKEVKVTADRARFEREVEVSAVRLETKQLQFIPKVGGEVDLFRTIQLLPGVISTSDFSNRLYIRGGSPDQNLILLDGITVYNPSHLFGLFSPFIADAVSDVTLLAGGFPAKYGSRLSSVLDVTTKEGNSKHLTGNGSASLIAAQGLVEGPIPRPKSEGRRTKDESIGKDEGQRTDESATVADSTAVGFKPSGSFLVAGRRTYLPDVLLGAFGVDGLGYYFYDLMGKANYEPWKDSRFTLTGLAAEDVLDFWDPENADGLKARLSWGNRGVSVRWNRVFTPILYGEVVTAWSSFFTNFKVNFGTPDTVEMAADLTDCTLKADLTWYAADRLTSDFGCEVRYATSRMSFFFDTTGFERAATFWPLALHADGKWELVAGRLFLKPGLRVSCYVQSQTDTGRADTTAEPNKGWRFAPEPRFGLKYLPGKNTALNLALGRFTQPLVTLNSTDAVFSIYDVWLPVPVSRALPDAYHCIAGAEQWFGRDIVVSLEGYYKNYDNLLETRYGQFFTQPDSLLDAWGFSYGADLMIRRTEGWVNGWISYSYMWTRRSIGDEAYHPHYDRRHNANLVLNFPKVYWGVDVAAKWTLGTGLPYSGSIGYYPMYQYRPVDPNWWRRPDWEFINGPRDAFRYPVYHRLDAGATKTWQKPWGEISAFLDIANLYNAQNVLLYYWEIGKDGLPVRRSVGMIPILPTVGVKVRF